MLFFFFLAMLVVKYVVHAHTHTEVVLNIAQIVVSSQGKSSSNSRAPRHSILHKKKRRLKKGRSDKRQALVNKHRFS